jgi:hypothetical protein
MNNYADKILVLDNVLSKDECEDLINFYKEIGPTKQHRDTFVLSLSDTMASKNISKIVNAYNNFSKYGIEVGWCEIVEWPPKSFHPAHNDDANIDISFTSVTYLNESYRDGRTFFINGIEIMPKIGRTVYFDGLHYRHGVTQVDIGVRYTLPIWYKKTNI